MYALFRGKTQLTGAFPSGKDVLAAALADGLIPDAALPADYRIEAVEEPYDPQPYWKLPREIS
jgi:hypothetical protein